MSSNSEASCKEDLAETKSDSDLATKVSSVTICSDEDSSESKNDSDSATPVSSSKICSEEDSSETKNDSDSATPDSSSKACSREDSSETRITFRSSTLEKAIDLVTRATEEDKRKNYIEAMRLYEHSVEYFLHAIKYEARSERAKEAIRSKCAAYLERAEKLKKYLISKNLYKTSGDTTSCNRTMDSSEDSDEEEEKLLNQVKGAISFEKPNINLSDVAGLDEAKDVLKEAVILPFKIPHLFEGKRRAWKRILLFGPPGAGKTFLVRALATQAYESTFCSVSPSHFLGESAKFVKNVFELARRKKPCIIFIDEIDILSFSSKQKESGEMIGIKAEFLTQMRDDTDEVVILGATNKPWVLDTDILSRFEKKIYIPLPDETARQAMLKSNVGNTPSRLSEGDFRLLAKGTDGFSGADISVLVWNALMMPVRKIQTATHFAKIRGASREHPDIYVDDLLTPCSPGTCGSIEMCWMDVPHDKLLEPAVSMHDVMECLKHAKPTVDDDYLWRLNRFMDH